MKDIIIMKYNNRNNEETIVITDENEHLFALNKDRSTVTDYSVMGGLEDIFSDIQFDDEVWISPECKDDMLSYIKENRDEIDEYVYDHLLMILIEQNGEPVQRKNSGNSMTPQELKERFCRDKIAVVCETEEEARKFIHWCYDNGYIWEGETRDDLHWIFGKDTCYSIFGAYLCFGDISDTGATYKAVRYKDCFR